MTELFIVLVIRTRRPFFHSRPGTLLLAATLVVAGTTIFLPCTPLGALFGFVPLSPLLVLLLLAISGGYLVASEIVKGWFFRRFAEIRSSARHSPPPSAAHIGAVPSSEPRGTYA